MKLKNLEVRKIIALFSTLLLGLSLGYCLIMGEKDIALMLIPVFSGAITWYFAKSTALDTPRKDDEV